MFDHFLTTLLQVFIVIDLVGAVAYFALGALRRKQRANEALLNPEPPAQPLALELDNRSFWQKLLPNRPMAFARSQDIDKLRQVLYSFQDGLT